MDSFLIPTFLKQLNDPSIENVLVCGCGGGFDFVHGLLVIPELLRMGKKVTIGSYSFGDPKRISGAKQILEEPYVCLVNAQCHGPPNYAPEIGMCQFLDGEYPQNAPHNIYAYYARDFCVPSLKSLMEHLIKKHKIDAVITIDGGTDSLVAGDEEGLGDPIEDCVSVSVLALLQNLKCKLLLTVGFGADRYNGVSDCASLRAVAEITKRGGFLGSVSVEQSSPAFQVYKRCVEQIYSQQSFRSVLTGLILASIEGAFAQEIPESIKARIYDPKTVFLWPLMAVIWAFDPHVVAKRSKIRKWIANCTSPNQCHKALGQGRSKLFERKKLRAVENLPVQSERF